MTEFTAFPKIPRLFRDIVITEKIDGTNAAVVIEAEVDTETKNAIVTAQSRSRLIYPSEDNHGFAVWVDKNKHDLLNVLGPGTHFGEWWGSGIQRGYGLKNGDKRFSLFNVSRWGDVDLSAVPGLGVVPTLYNGPFDLQEVYFTLGTLKHGGSQAAPGFKDPEGIIVFHTAANSMFKVTCNNDEKPKGSNEAS